jgi:K+-sensing histidine kinase KdpD
MTLTAAQDRLQAQTVSPASNVETERERLHRRILSSVSHDLKTPLASIIGSLEVYERMNGRLTENQQKSLIEVALQEAYRLDNFITNILDMAKLENGMVKLRQDEIPINSLLDDCVTRLGNRLKGSEVSIEAPVETLIISTDSILLGRVICLMLDNAVKYGGKPPTIRIVFGKSEDGRGFIRIGDNGQGIPEGQTEKVFEKYTRFTRGDQQNAGTGLGLAICREIMRLLNGTVTAANSDNGGALFTLSLPSV